jgi:hypothetical protein
MDVAQAGTAAGHRGGEQVTWTKLSDDFSDDCWTLSDAAVRLHVDGLLWSNRKLLDLHLPKDDLRRFSKRPEAATELVAAEWWADRGEYYVIRHHAAYQRTRKAVVNQQEANLTNGRKGGRPPGKPREIVPRPETHSLSDSVSDSPTERGRTGLAQYGGRACVEAEHELDAPEIPEGVQLDASVSPFHQRYTS